jgi:hypothetical protein
VTKRPQHTPMLSVGLFTGPNTALTKLCFASSCEGGCLSRYTYNDCTTASPACMPWQELCAIPGLHQPASMVCLLVLTPLTEPNAPSS